MSELDLICAIGMGRGVYGIEKSLVVAKDIGLCDAEFEVQDIKVLSFNATNVPLTEDTGAKSPVHVLKGGVVKILGGYYDGTQEYSL